MKRKADWLVLIAFASAVSIPTQASGFPPSLSLSLRSGYVAVHPAEGATYSIAPSLSLTRSLGGRTALWSSVGYIQVRDARVSVRPSLGLGNSGNLRDLLPGTTDATTHVVPVALGLRMYPKQGERSSPGPFFEIGPTAYFARYDGSDYAHHTAILGGLQAGVGLRFIGYGSSRGEIGLSYHLAEAIGSPAGALGRVGTSGEVDYSLLSAFIAIGFGD